MVSWGRDGYGRFRQAGYGKACSGLVGSGLAGGLWSDVVGFYSVGQASRAAVCLGETGSGTAG